MKAIAIDQFGGVDVMRLRELPTPTFQEHELLIKIHYAGVNPVDWKIREGHLESALPHHFPIILGWDASGTIEAMGSAVTGFHVGEAVYAYCRKPTVQDGAYAEYIVLDAASVAPKPKQASFAEAASVPLASLTAWQALHDFSQTKPGQVVLIHAGSGGVGSFAIQFAKLIGAKVITTCSGANIEYVKSLGADYAIDYTKEKFADAVKKLFPEGVDLVFDTVGGKTLDESLPIVKKGGTLVTIVERLDAERGRPYGITTGFVFVRPNGHELREIGKLIDEDKVKIPALTELPLEEAAKAHELSKATHTRGKMVLKI